MSLISYEKLWPADLTPAVVKSLQITGFKAWREGFRATRSSVEIKNMFNWTDPEALAKATKAYKRCARRGALVIAKTFGERDHSDKIIGYAMAQNDVSGNVVERLVNRTFRRDKVHARLLQVNVVPDFQRQGVGTQLIELALSRQWGRFNPRQVLATDLFSENHLAWTAAQNLGFELSPPDQEATITHAYFGADAEPAYQYSLAGPSVHAVLNAVAAKRR